MYVRILYFVWMDQKDKACAAIRKVFLLTCYCLLLMGNCILECANNNEDTNHIIKLYTQACSLYFQTLGSKF